MAEATDEQIAADEPTVHLKRPRGKPRKNGVPSGSMPVVVRDIPNPRIRKYYSDHDNPAQKTKALWLWWNQLPTPMKEIIEAHVYREWPVLLDPTDEKEYKYIDKIIGVAPVQSDHDFVDMYGAGDFKIYLNVNPAAAPRRTLAEAWVKCSHDFTKYPPSDNRVINVDNISQTDPSNKAYVGWLRSQGKLKDDAKEAKEKEEMSATADVLGKVLDQNTAVMNRILDEKDKQLAEPGQLPPDPPPSPQEVISEQLSIFKSLKELVPTSDPLEMVKQVIGMAQVLTQGKDSSADIKPLQDEIGKLREQLRSTETEMWSTRFTELKEQIRAVKEAPPVPNVLLPDGSNLNAVIEKAVAKAFDAGVPEDTAWYVEPLKQLLPAAVPALMLGLQRLLSPTPSAPGASFQMPPANFQAGTTQAHVQPQPQQQLPPPQPQTQQQAPPQPNAEEAEINRVLTAISSPVIDALASGDDGDVFADYVREEFGASSQRLLAKFSEQEISAALYVFPLTAQRMTQFPQERVAKFVAAFKTYDRDVFDKKLEAEEKGRL